MRRTPEEWRAVCAGITAGYVPDSGKEDTHANGVLYVSKWLHPRGLPAPGSTVVDVGCGNGRLAMGMAEDAITYLGLEIIPASVAFCRAAFAPWPHFRFEHLDVRNGHYYRRNSLEPTQATFPLADNLADLVVVSSVFTHLTPAAAVRRYVAECSRILKPGGLLFSTWLRHPPNEPSRHESRTVYAEADIRAFLAGFTWLEEWGGTRPVRGDQWMILAVKPVETSHAA